MEIATDDDKITAPDDDKLLVRFGHLNWLHLRTIDIRAMRDLNRVWEALQAIRAAKAKVRAQIEAHLRAKAVADATAIFSAIGVKGLPKRQPSSPHCAHLTPA